jgi:predicted HAD superfamily phosphohydrolase YqeG
MAHKNGLVGILVRPIDTSSEDWGIRVMRFFENI